MARQLREPNAPANIIELAKKHFPCTCGEIYLSRNLTAPDCPYHAFEWEEFASDLLSIQTTLEMTAEEFFDKHSDCYADTWKFENDGSYTEGEVIMAITKESFIKALNEYRLQGE